MGSIVFKFQTTADVRSQLSRALTQQVQINRVDSSKPSGTIFLVALKK